MLVQPVLVYEAGAARLRTVYKRAVSRDLRFALYTADLFSTGKDEDNRAAVRAVPSADLDLVGLALRAPHKAVDGVVRGLTRKAGAGTLAAWSQRCSAAEMSFARGRTSPRAASHS
jgi:hypothetical protein